MKPNQPELSFIPVLCPGIGIWSVGFCELRKIGEPKEETLGARQAEPIANSTHTLALGRFERTRTCIGYSLHYVLGIIDIQER